MHKLIPTGRAAPSPCLCYGCFQCSACLQSPITGWGVKLPPLLAVYSPKASSRGVQLGPPSPGPSLPALYWVASFWLGAHSGRSESNPCWRWQCVGFQDYSCFPGGQELCWWLREETGFLCSCSCWVKGDDGLSHWGLKSTSCWSVWDGLPRPTSPSSGTGTVLRRAWPSLLSKPPPMAHQLTSRARGAGHSAGLRKEGLRW